VVTPVVQKAKGKEKSVRPRGLPVSKISPKWVMSQEQVKSSDGIVTFSFGTGMIWDGIAPIPDEIDILQ
jgi:hypothetical protein